MKKLMFIVSTAVFMLYALQVSTKIVVNLGPCKNDIETFCNGETRLGPVLRCLEQHGNEISELCNLQLKSIQDRVHNLLMACKDDISFVCQGAKQNEVLDCLDRNKSEVSDGCRQHLDNGR
jgi:hypothetical protein